MFKGGYLFQTIILGIQPLVFGSVVLGREQTSLGYLTSLHNRERFGDTPRFPRFPTFLFWTVLILMSTIFPTKWWAKDRIWGLSTNQIWDAMFFGGGPCFFDPSLFLLTPGYPRGYFIFTACIQRWGLTNIKYHQMYHITSPSSLYYNPGVSMGCIFCDGITLGKTSCFFWMGKDGNFFLPFQGRKTNVWSCMLGVAPSQ